jgi:hypothetical protein
MNSVSEKNQTTAEEEKKEIIKVQNRKRKQIQRGSDKLKKKALNMEFRKGMMTVDCNRNACNDAYTHETLEELAVAAFNDRVAKGDARRIHVGSFSSRCSIDVRHELQAASAAYFGKHWNVVASGRTGGEGVKKAVGLALSCALSLDTGGLKKSIEARRSMTESVLLLGPQHTGPTAEMVDDMTGASSVCGEPRRWCNEERARRLGLQKMLTVNSPDVAGPCDKEDLKQTMEELLRQHNKEPVGCILIDTCMVWFGDRPLYYYSEFLLELQEFARTINALLVVDECLSGLGRTGPPLGFEHYFGNSCSYRMLLPPGHY